MGKKIDYSRILKITRVILIAIPVIILVFILNKRLVFWGVLGETYSFKKPGVIISSIFPPANVENIEKNIIKNEYYQQILKSPVYFRVEVPFDAKLIDLEMEYQNPSTPIFELGVKKGNVAGSDYFNETIENKIIEKSSFFRTDDLEKGVIFLQKPIETYTEDETGVMKKNITYPYNSFDEFIENIPDDKSIGFYQYDLSTHYLVKNYQSSDTVFMFDKAIRGEHEIVTYVDDENLDFTFFYQERNPWELTEAEDFRVKVYQGDQFVAQFDQATYIPKENLILGKERSLRVFLEKPPRGIYHLKIETDADVIINKFYTYQQLFGFKEQVFLNDPNQSSKFFVTSNTLSFKTDHETGFQTIKANEREQKIEALHNFVSFVVDENIQEVNIPINDVIFRFRGIATLDSETYQKLTSNYIDL
ncbi:MAG: hypothetical protein ACD_31C00050G0003, partial [uncultured bacterium]